MIVVLQEDLFADEATDDVALISVVCDSRGRYKVQTRPAYRSRGETALHRWLGEQSPKVRGAAELVLAEGLKAAEYGHAGGAREPMVLVERREAPSWPDDLRHGAIRLPLAAARDLLARPLRLLLENGRNDWGFLGKVVPSAWKARWDRAVKERWIEAENGGGITEMRKIILQQIAPDDARRLRTWAMFDSDGRRAGDSSDAARATRAACEQWGVAYHPLRRRAIENYVPKEALFDWAQRRRKRDDREEKLLRVRAYCAMTEEQRHYFNMKEGFVGDERSDQGVCDIYDNPFVDRLGPLRQGLNKDLAQEIWGDNPYDGPTYEISEACLVSDGFEPERAVVFQSIFSRL
ncbi:MAG TPA: hypothetical protein VLS89_18820 [Candidatus Nanopelagicales bacterium]|nr:hypothetical protein [Candidatus Nanopelagicales bacterium]